MSEPSQKQRLTKRARKRAQQEQQQQLEPPPAQQQQQQPFQSQSNVQTGPKKPTPTNLDLVPVIPKRPLRTKKAPGTPVQLVTNLFRLLLTQSRKIYSFTIDVEEQRVVEEKRDGTKKGSVASSMRRVPRDIKRELIERALQKWQAEQNERARLYYVLDNSASIMYALFNMFQEAKEPREKLSKSFDEEYEQKMYLIKFNNVGPLDITDFVNYCKNSSNNFCFQDYTRAINTILQAKITTLPNYLVTQAKTGVSTVFPYTERSQFKISPGVILGLQGYSLSSRPTEEGIVVNIANSVGAFYEPIDLIDFVRKSYTKQDLGEPLPEWIVKELTRELKNKQVELKHIKYGSSYKKQRIGSISTTTARTDKFTWVDHTKKTSREVTVEDYFNHQYPGHALRYPNMPCIIDNGRKFPFEVCVLVEKQKVARKLDSKETNDFLNRAALRPKDHFERVQNNANEVERQSRADLQQFGLKLDPKPIEVEGREIDPPKLKGGSGSQLTPSDGQYYLPPRETFVRPATVGLFAVALIVDRQMNQVSRKNTEQDIRNDFLSKYCSHARQKGVNIDIRQSAIHFIPLTGGTYDRTNEAELKETLKKYITDMNERKLDHAIIVLPKGCSDSIYGHIQYLETSVSCRGRNETWTRTSCVKSENFSSRIVPNIWLKYNTKLGGVNITLFPDAKVNFHQVGWLFISVDVCHPSPNDTLTQSIAAVVGMWDITNKNMSFCTRIRAQRKERSKTDKSTKEEVNDIDIMVSDIVESYRARKNKLPTNIVILRDGVSEGQFIMVSNYELERVINALKNKYQLTKQKSPLISCVIVQKRHKIRFMRKEPAQTRKGPDDNIQPGTVVDNTITRPNEFSFYIAPHKAIKGTSRAPYAFFIYDEIKFDQDTAQMMIHSLSYLSPRCNKSTSIPTPVNLADLAAERGKNIVVSWNSDNMRLAEADRFNKLNEFLSDKLGDDNYKNTLYYV